VSLSVQDVVPALDNASNSQEPGGVGHLIEALSNAAYGGGWGGTLWEGEEAPTPVHVHAFAQPPSGLKWDMKQITWLVARAAGCTLTDSTGGGGHAPRWVGGAATSSSTSSATFTITTTTSSSRQQEVTFVQAATLARLLVRESLWCALQVLSLLALVAQKYKY
jgi:hypothetical protein